MGNTILTPDIIAREALMVLRNNAVMSKLVHRDYSKEFAAVGDTITVRKPATFTANEFSSSISVQDATEGSVAVKMDKLLDVSFAVTSKEMALDIADFSQQFLTPAMQAFADKIDKYLIAEEKAAVNRVDHTTNEIAPADLVAARKFLTKNAAPLSDRNFVIGADAEADLLNNSQFTSAEKVGDEGTALREASLGRKYGMDIYVDQNIASVTPDNTLNKTALKINGAVSASDTIGLDATSLTGKITAGTILAIGGEHYIVQNEVTAADAALAGVKVDRALSADDNADVTVIGAYTPSIAFHKNALALVTRPLELPLGTDKAAIVDYDGFALRVVYGYDIDTKKDTVSIDMLCGTKLLDEKLIAVVADERTA